MHRLLSIVLGVVVASGLALGCGSGEDEATSATPLTKAQFIERADAICTKESKRLQAEYDAWEKEIPGGLAGVRKNLDEVAEQIIAPSQVRKGEELESLAPPVEDEAEVARMLRILLEVARAAEREGMESFLSPRSAPLKREMEAYGFKICDAIYLDIPVG
jgi:hypothetical protein